MKKEDKIKGFRVEKCLGATGCPNRTIKEDELPQILEQKLAKRDLKTFLKSKVRGPLKFHHEFKVSISYCPNACSRPQIVDIGIIGALKPGISDKTCNQCKQCLKACRENAISLNESGPEINTSRCLFCGRCIENCPTGTIKEEKKGFRVLIGGRLGRHPKLGAELGGIYQTNEVLKIVDQCLDHYMKHCKQGERFGRIIERTGIDGLIP